MAKYLIAAKIPKKLYYAVKEHCERCDPTKITGNKPLARPAALPMSNAPHEVLQIDFVWYEGDELIHVIDTFTKFSVLGELELKGKSAAQAIINFLWTRWFCYFGKPQVIFIDPDTRHSKEGLQELCDTMSVQLIRTPSSHHQGIGIVERHHQVLRNFMYELAFKSEYKDMELDELAGIAMLLHNSQISQVDGQTPGHRLYGSSPRLPLIAADNANFKDIENAYFQFEAPQTKTQRIISKMNDCRILCNKKTAIRAFSGPRREGIERKLGN